MKLPFLALLIGALGNDEEICYENQELMRMMIAKRGKEKINEHSILTDYPIQFRPDPASNVIF